MELSSKTSDRKKKFASKLKSEDPLGPPNEILNRNLIDWGPDDVKSWLRVQGFPEFWTFLEPHNPTGIDLLMLTPVRIIR